MCGTLWAVHEQDKPSDYAPGFLTCTTRTAINGARAAWAKTAQGEAEAEAVKDGAADPNASRVWLAVPKGAPGPILDPLD